MTITLPITSVQAAIRAKCPVTGIPVIGHVPIRLDRSRLRDSLKGLTLISCEYVDGNLRVVARGERVKATRTFFPMSRIDASKLIDKFVKSERAKRCRPKPATSTGRKLQELQTKLDKISHRPKNPAIANGYAVPEFKRIQFLEWHRQKAIRRTFKQKSAFQTAVLTGKIDAEMSNPAGHYDWPTCEPEWGANRYSFLFNDERAFLKDQIRAVMERMTGANVTRVSAFTRRIVV